MPVTVDDERYMRHALDACRHGVERGQAPFGACIVRAGEVLATAHNQVWANTDPTAHAEVQAIRQAARALGELLLEGATIYSTTEPCPMCFTAIHWARIGRIVYGAAIADAARFGFNELAVSNRTLKREGGLTVAIDGGVLAADSVALFELWSQSSGARSY